MSSKINKRLKSFYIHFVAFVFTVFYYVGIGFYRALKFTFRVCTKAFISVGKCVFSFILTVYNNVVKVIAQGFICYFKSFIKAFKNIKELGFLKAYRSHIDELKQSRNKNLYKFNRFVRTFSFSAVVLLLVFTYGIWSQFTVCYEVEYNGSSIGFIKSTMVYDEAVDCLGEYVESSNAEKIVSKPTFKFSVSKKTDLIEKNTLAVGMIKETSGFKYAYGLYIDGERVLVCENYDSIDYNLRLLLNDYEYSGKNLVLEFVEEVQIIPSYYAENTVLTANGVYDYFDNNELPLTVKATMDETYKKTLKYKTEKIENENKIVGFKLTVCEGENGIVKVTDSVSYINGEEVSRTEKSRETVKQAVNERIIYGTATMSSGSIVQSMSAGANYIWPVANSGRANVSAYYGDGRNHKGIDIAVPAGRGILSVADGVVVASGWNAAGSGYGNSIIVKHSDGTTSTLYAHASALYVTEGDVVKVGQVIAAVGSTGNSTGNHLHFEVIKNGVKLNPASFLGLN